MPTLTIDDALAHELRRIGTDVELLDSRGISLGAFVPKVIDLEAERRRQWVQKLALEFPPEALEQIEGAPGKSMAEVVKLVGANG